MLCQVIPLFVFEKLKATRVQSVLIQFLYCRRACCSEIGQKRQLESAQTACGLATVVVFSRWLWATARPIPFCAAPQPFADRLPALWADISFLAIRFWCRCAPLKMPQNSIASLCLSPEIKELLIRCVKTRPAIWDSTSEEYSDTNSRRRAYLEVAKILGDQNGCQYKRNCGVLISNRLQQVLASEIQVEWKKMRDVFNRTLKKVMQSNGRYEIG